MKKRCFGFSLIEILITLAVAGTLIAIAMPVYHYVTVKAFRSQAASCLIQLANALEQYHLKHHTYENVSLSGLNFPEFISNQRYQIIIQSTPYRYLLIAYPLATQAKQDTGCGALTLNSELEKGVTGPNKVRDCW